MARNTREGTEATRLALMAAGRQLFVENGFAETATPDIVALAGVTRGALYHHFADKKALLRTIVEAEAAAVAAAIDSASDQTATPRDALVEGAAAYFAAMAVPGRVRLLLLEAPAVLGVAGAEQIDREHAGDRLQAGVRDYLGAGVPGAEAKAITTLLSSAFDRAALEIERGGDARLYERSIARLIDALGRS
jgi:AcrR family transcriptional regulator